MAESSDHIGHKHPTRYFPSLSFAMFSNAFLVLVGARTFKKMHQTHSTEI